MLPSKPGATLLLAAGAAGSLVLGLVTGLARLGWFPSPLAAFHGPLMICGFLGVVVGLERAVALGRRWAYQAPALAFSGTALVAAGLLQGRLLVVLGSLIMLAANLAVMRRRADLATGTIALGSLAWLVGNVLWAAGWTLPALVRWWIAFPVLTIAGERLELAAMRRPPHWARGVFLAIVVLILSPAMGLGLVALALWLLRFDLAWRTVRSSGLTRYVAVCLLSGYAWLLAGGALQARFGLPPGGPLYDAILHSLLLGFMVAMMFGHALLVLPAVTGIALRYSSWLYLPLAWLHLSTALRLAADLGWLERAWAGLGNVLAFVLFAACLGLSRLYRPAGSSARAVANVPRRSSTATVASTNPPEEGTASHRSASLAAPVLPIPGAKKPAHSQKTE